MRLEGGKRRGGGGEKRRNKIHVFSSLIFIFWDSCFFLIPIQPVDETMNKLRTRLDLFLIYIPAVSSFSIVGAFLHLWGGLCLIFPEDLEMIPVIVLLLLLFEAGL